MHLKTRILDKYFLKQIKKKGIEATEKEVYRFFNENGWRLYDMDSMLNSFTKWRMISQK
ncbi:MAG: hypothetical protein ACNS62_21585 [Candidatus Cyclobacteriaceae bacterium M3_2C_046]